MLIVFDFLYEFRVGNLRASHFDRIADAVVHCPLGLTNIDD